MAYEFFSLALGLALLFLGGKGLVSGAAAISTRLGVPPMIIGLTIVGFGTSMPELLVSIQAAQQGYPDLAVGNVVGSNIANILLILGFTAVIYPISTAIPSIRRDIAVMFAVAILAIVLPLFGVITRLTGSLMLTALAGYLLYAAFSGEPQEESEASAQKISMPLQILSVIAGLAALVFGADFLIDGATSIARVLGVPEAVIGLTIVAIGTSLPELAASAVAAFKKHSEIAIGNVIGSNIFNILGILGATAILHPVTIAPQIASFDIPVMIGVSALLVVLVVGMNALTRLVGAGFLAAYAFYCVYLFKSVPLS